jgi:hypothetical protein
LVDATDNHHEPVPIECAAYRYTRAKKSVQLGADYLGRSQASAAVR